MGTGFLKRSGQHPERALSAVQVRNLKTAGRYADGGGLYLLVKHTGAKSWVLRITAQGRRQDIGLGAFQIVSLAEAREQAAALRKLAKEGGSPVAERRKERASVPTFKAAALAVHAEHKAAWKNGKHQDQWLSTLEAYAFPLIGERRIDQIDTPDVLRVLSPIWLTKPETARRVRQRIKTVLDWAGAAGHRSGENPVLLVAKGLPRQADRQEHHSAMPFDEVPAFVAGLADAELGDSARLALEFLILTAARTGEVLGATWTEIDATEAVWAIPAERMKGGREHRIPLCSRALEILAQGRELAGTNPHVFPGRTRGKPLSNMALLMAMRRHGSGYTVHGFRSSFRDWASERTNAPREVCEAALAHAVRDKVEAAYRRSDLFQRRRELMATWAVFLSGESANGL